MSRGPRPDAPPRASVLARVLRGVVVGVGVGLLSLAAAAPAAAALNDPDDRIVGYDMVVDLDDDGVAQVTVDLDFEFGSRPNHGPYLTYLVKQRFDDTQDRVLRYTHWRVSSDTAPDAVSVEEEGPWLIVKIGDEDRTITGLHSYRITFQVEGWVNSAGFDWPEGELTQDELYLNVITDWGVPLEQVRVQVNGPADVLDVACWRTGTEPCASAAAQGSTAEFTQEVVPRRTPLTVAVAYPAGAFGGAEPVLQERWAAERAFAVNPGTGVAAGLVGVAGGALVIRRVRREGRDAEFLGLTPGLTPVGDQPATVGERRKRAVAVQFQPPAGFQPGQIGTLVDEVADPHDVTATIIDLAVRQYLRIVRLDDGTSEGDWRLDRSDKPAGDLRPYESLLLDEIFDDQPSVQLSDLKTTFATSMAAVQGLLYAEVTQQGWFRGNPREARTKWAVRGVLVLLGAIAVTALLAIFTHWGLVGLPLVGVGVLMLALTKAAPARTATGTAVLHQAEGFRHYLATAEANQLRFEEGEDLFSRYLPYAVAFGLTERWAHLFAQLAAQGRVLAEPTWFIGPYHGLAFWSMAGTFGRDLSGFTQAATTAISAPAPGSSGGSGFSGGGFGGGGVGGGGGGSW